MQLKPITAIIVLIVVASLSVAGCTTGSNSPSNTATPTATPTAKPTPTPAPDYTALLNSNPYLANGFVITTPYKKTTINGKVAYEGVLSKTGTAFKEQLFPMDSYSDALRYGEELIASYKAQGYTTSYSANSDFWRGDLGNTGVSIGAQESLTLPQPYTSVEIFSI